MTIPTHYVIKSSRLSVTHQRYAFILTSTQIPDTA
jgi:hypothetical protein